MNGSAETCRITVLDGHTLNPGDNPWDEVGVLGEVRVHPRTAPEAVIERSRDAVVLVVNKVKLPRDVLSQLPSLRLIAVTATGFDCVDAKAAREFGIAVTNVPEYGTNSVAQHVFALMLALSQRVETHDRAVHAGEWAASPDFCFAKTPLVELAGKTLGLIGLGRIANRVAEIGTAVGMHAIAYRRDSTRQMPAGIEGVTRESLLARSDVISLHCPATPETLGMVNASFLQSMKRTAWLINTARGSLVNETDLATALASGTIAAAALDVLAVEPPTANNPLLSVRNCIITPHIAWATLAARRRLMTETAANIAAFLDGRPRHVVN